MKSRSLRGLLALVLGVGFGVLPVMAAQASAAADSGASRFDVLQGKWVRPDGGYTITIESIGPNGELQAAYANPAPLPFEQAKAALDGAAITVFLELRAGGYNGSTYNLKYHAATDVLRGVYYQAVAKQKFDVYFERVK